MSGTEAIKADSKGVMWREARREETGLSLFRVIRPVLPNFNEAEDAKPEDLEAGCNVLLHAMLKMANV